MQLGPPMTRLRVDDDAVAVSRSRTFVLRIPVNVVKLLSVAQVSGKHPLGVLAALSTGFDTVTRQLWLLALPAALDVFLWLGPRLKAPGVWPLFMFDIPPGLDARTRLFAQDLQESLRQILENANWFAWLRPAFLGASTLSGALVEPPPGVTPTQWPLGNTGALVLAVIVLVVLGIGLSGFYWSLIARQARDGRIDWWAAWGRMAVVWPRMLALALLLIVMITIIWMPALILSALLGPALGVLGALLVMLSFALLVWLLFYTAFSVHGIVLYNHRVLDAVRVSVELCRAHFWKTLGLLATLIAVEWGMGLIWNMVPSSSWLWAVSIAGNAFVVAGLSMASMLYYLEYAPIPRSTLAPQ